MIPMLFAAIVGGLTTVSVVGPFSASAAIIVAPFGSSLCAVLMAFHIARHRGSEEQIRVEVDEQTDAMVASLRDLTAQAKLVSQEDNAKQLRENDSRKRVA
jgi:hypothetical protein